MALNLVVERLPDAGIPIHSMRVAGGGSRSDICVQINSDILGAPLERADVTEAGALGAAILAGVGCGIYGSIDEALTRLVRVDRVFEPDARRHARYQELFGFYKEARGAMADLLRRFTAARDGIRGPLSD
jgi:sugar (pentulose or hexulose) kinase